MIPVKPTSTQKIYVDHASDPIAMAEPISAAVHAALNAKAEAHEAGMLDAMMAIAGELAPEPQA